MIDAGAVRFRPMLLSAWAMVVGAAVILFDPIFRGLAIARMAGEIASLSFSRMTVPILRLFAGAFAMASLALGYWVSPCSYLFTAFVGRRARPIPSAATTWWSASRNWRSGGPTAA